MTHVICISLSDEEFEKIKKMAQDLNIKFEDAVERIITRGILDYYKEHYRTMKLREFLEAIEEYERREKAEAEKNG